jgi:hypothetical protein
MRIAMGSRGLGARRGRPRRTVTTILKGREQAKKRAPASTARRPNERDRFIRAAARGGFGPCFISIDWDDQSAPALLSVVVARELGARRLPDFEGP